ncbi:MAG: cupin domain-containing protein [Candidatus Eremiobacteraeota bacterium]|nr:cupin domain-containing protein [Candidatus Eremiobacteraeota bacterium]
MRYRVSQLAQRLPDQGERYVEAFRHQHMRAVLYAPKDHDPQKPHREDEVYVVISGSGRLRVGEQVTDFEPGDLLYVEAGAPHRFEDFSPDLTVWAIFGPVVEGA